MLFHGALVLGHRVVGHDLALEHPHLDTAGAVGGEGRGRAVIDIGSQRVERHPALPVPFHAGDLGAAEPAGTVDPNALGAEPHGRLHGALHGAAEGDPALQLLGDVLGHQLGVDLGLANLDDVDVNLALDHLHELGAQSLDVEDAWERAVETVLGEYLQAICVSDVATATSSLSQLKTGRVTFLLEQTQSDVADSEAVTLISKVDKAPAAVTDLLRTVRVADSLNKAIAIREKMRDDESVITADGVWLSKHWLRVSRDKDAKAGVLTREHDMRRLKTEVREAKARSDGARKLVQDGRSRLNQLEERREKLQINATSLLNEYSELKANLDSAQYRVDQANARHAAITEERGDIEKEKFSAEEQARESRSRFDQATEYLDELEVHRETLESQRDELRAELDRVRAQADQDRLTAQEIAIQFESRRSTKDSAAQNLARMESQLQQFQTREQEIREQLEQSQEPLAENKTQLDEQL